MRVMKVLTVAGMALGAMLGVGATNGGVAQAQAPASVHGHTQNPVGAPIKGAMVEFSKTLSGPIKDRVWTYKFAVDASGDYKGTGIIPGEYSSALFADDKTLDIVDSIKFAPGEDKQFDYDLSRQAYLDKMTPEEKAQLEDYKKKAGAAMDANKVIAGLNSTLKTVRADLTAASPTQGDVSKDVSSMKDATTSKPDEGLLWSTYGDTLQAQGDHLAKADRDQKKAPTSDPDVTSTYTSAVDAYKKGIDLNAASKKPTPVDAAVAYNQMGNLLAKLGKPQDAVSAFDNAAKLDPAKAGMYYGNEAANLFNSGATQEAADAATKAIAADPTRPDPYFVRGQALITKATVDKAGKIVAPPECIDAYQKYLELAPEGKFAPQVKEILQSMGQTINTKYKAGKK